MQKDDKKFDQHASKVNSQQFNVLRKERVNRPKHVQEAITHSLIVWVMC